MNFVVVKQLHVRRRFSAGPTAGALKVERNCGIGCTCEATIYKTSGPSPSLAERKTLCFNDGKRQGISEIAGTARLIPAEPGVTEYALLGDLVEARDEPF